MKSEARLTELAWIADGNEGDSFICIHKGCIIHVVEKAGRVQERQIGRAVGLSYLHQGQRIDVVNGRSTPRRTE